VTRTLGDPSVPFNFKSSEATAVDGGNVVGHSRFILPGGSPFFTHAFLWTAADGMIDSGRFPMD
jgi:hypothetical protein